MNITNTGEDTPPPPRRKKNTVTFSIVEVSLGRSIIDYEAGISLNLVAIMFAAGPRKKLCCANSIRARGARARDFKRNIQSALGKHVICII